MIEQAFCKASNDSEDEILQEGSSPVPEEPKKDAATSLPGLIKFLEKEVLALSQQNDEHLSV